MLVIEELKLGVSTHPASSPNQSSPFHPSSSSPKQLLAFYFQPLLPVGCPSTPPLCPSGTSATSVPLSLRSPCPSASPEDQPDSPDCCVLTCCPLWRLRSR